eukprot:CAMPEP_0117429314 /NCGR_PEP_ID=MMETSP0758-20121206/8871_1 /TAXON_ID=63605 /ORGANISM="Percolomonas cosmopolitus, Strain AE-1 (ATCC 50343)" /LENGTH=310 /DNA_ID=CAMNT_0005216245 /DNA_START=722 /DNA_END=1651 /DNA_ORIENTATION=-
MDGFELRQDRPSTPNTIETNGRKPITKRSNSATFTGHIDTATRPSNSPLYRTTKPLSRQSSRKLLSRRKNRATHPTKKTPNKLKKVKQAWIVEPPKDNPYMKDAAEIFVNHQEKRHKTPPSASTTTTKKRKRKVSKKKKKSRKKDMDVSSITQLENHHIPSYQIPNSPPYQKRLQPKYKSAIYDLEESYRKKKAAPKKDKSITKRLLDRVKKFKRKKKHRDHEEQKLIDDLKHMLMHTEEPDFEDGDMPPRMQRNDSERSILHYRPRKRPQNMIVQETDMALKRKAEENQLKELEKQRQAELKRLQDELL